MTDAVGLEELDLNQGRIQLIFSRGGRTENRKNANPTVLYLRKHQGINVDHQYVLLKFLEGT